MKKLKEEESLRNKCKDYLCIKISDWRPGQVFYFHQDTKHLLQLSEEIVPVIDYRFKCMHYDGGEPVESLT